ncbi:DUF4386 domain-containing protein [Emticicia sp. 17c]|uniref:DUF4386 domain-containing protein n=1 Tax=Emticicia sp. 17c TaxID=3127704 RepID=UPI00301BE8A7
MNIETTGHLLPNTLLPQHRNISRAAGLFYLLTFVSVPTLFLYGPIHEPAYLLGNGNDNGVIIGGISEIVVALCGIITAVVLYPLLRKQNESLAMGLVAARILEAGTMFTGVALLLGVVSLRQTGAGAEALPVAQTLVILYDRIFVLGQGFIPAINDLLLGLLLYRSGLVPRFLALIGIAGGLPLLAGYFALIFGLIDRISPLAGLSALMVAVFEFSLGIYLLFKGFKASSPLLNAK